MATLYGWLIGFGLVVFLAFLIESIGLGGYQFFIGIGVGVGLGYVQARVTRLHFGIGYPWMYATIFGLGFSFVLFDLGHKYSGFIPEYNLFYSIALGGLLTSLTQYFLLRRIFRHAVLWIPISTLGWILAGALIRFTETLKNFGIDGLPAAIIVLIILTVGASLVLGTITGIGMNIISS